MTRPFSRRALMTAAAALALPGGAAAQAWPNKPVRLVVPFSAGAGISDILARLIGQHLSTALGQQMVIDNRPGAGGNLGADIVAKAAPDGYTVLLGSSFLAVNAYLYAQTPFDALADFAPVSSVAINPLLLVVHPSVPARSVAELVALAKAKPGQLNYGSGGIGSTPFLATEQFKARAGIDITHVPYKGGAPALADLAAGQLSMMIENMPGTMPFVRSGRMRALAITSRQRSSLEPELPTMIEAGVPDYEMIGWNGFFFPKGTPAEIVTRLQAALVGVLAKPEVKEQLVAIGAEGVGDSPQSFAAFFKNETTRWGRLIKDLGIKPE
ncbi:MAG: tripartite tricarboxylate transporter substrate binding protein [Reyranella sp.]|uniref:Bug family tripartite tricarboxylate transporter substrate binding protein n=1 Tax=Reyranella sp. TaxID=1929291 RepID=UPI001ACA8E8E|nr:tripartite tricarboxylate transporter substrate binding protein [Reyranella sp.]MBN9091152.1 tripartite tricarboxylate transporter substrate binding protein [Reyranella sp.]